MTKAASTNKYILLFAATYFVSYMTRINFGAIVSEVELATGMSRAMLSMSLTGSFITYGVGQLVSGVCGDKFSPKKLICFGFIMTVFMNLLLPFCGNPYQMLVVWCINGFAQSFMWPPLVKIMTAVFSEADYPKVVVKVSWGSALGTIAIYLLAPAIISLFNWKAVFFFSAAAGALMLLIWNRFCVDVSPVKKIDTKASVSTRKGVLFTPLLISIMLAILLHGMLKEGVSTWMPSFISETYNMSNVIAILTGVVLPIFGMICNTAAQWLDRTLFKNPVLCAGAFFAVASASSLGLTIINGKSAAVSVVFSSLLSGCMHGINIMLVCVLPSYFKKYGNVSTASGVLNFSTYIGSAVSTYGIAVLSERMGWSFTIMIWFLIAMLGAVICFICVVPWRRKMEK